MIKNNNHSLLSETINSYKNYEYNWDGYDGVPASKQTIDDALFFISLIKQIPIELSLAMLK